MGSRRAYKISDFVAQGANVTCLEIGHKNNRIVATAGEDKKVNIWTMERPTCIMSLTGHSSIVQTMAFSNNEDKIVTGSSSGSLKIWDLEMNKLNCNLSGHKSTVSCLKFHAYADYVTSGSLDSTIRLWDLRRKGCIFTYKGHTGAINSLKFSPDSKWIASVGDDCLVKIWDLKAGKLLTDLKGHTGPINSLEFHPNEFLLATGSADRTVKFWDLEKFELVSTSSLNPNSIKAVIFEPNGKCLFAASNEYLHSYSWEPSVCHDSVYCQWKQVYDVTISQNKLLAASFSQNMVSMFAVELSQVAPTGVPPAAHVHPNPTPTDYPVTTNIKSGGGYQVGVRKNFHPQDIEKPAEAKDDVVQSNNDSVNDEIANICDVNEYNKIFRPQKEIKRAPEVNFYVKSSQVVKSPNNPTTSSNNRLTQLDQAIVKTDSSSSSNVFKPVNDANEKPQNLNSPVQPSHSFQATKNSMQQFKKQLSDDSNFPKVEIVESNKPVFQQQQSVPNTFHQQHQQQTPQPQHNFNPNFDDFMPKKENVDKIEAIELLSGIDQGHDSFLKVIKTRYKSFANLRTMWTNGNIRTALDTAVNMDDLSVMADLLGQLNQTASVWTLDICIILLPSIKNLIESKYEEHIQVGCDSCKIVFKNFGKLIKANLLPSHSNGVDIMREERQRKCRSCYNYLSNIMTIIEKKQNNQIVSSKLQANFRELNLLMKTIIE